LRAGSGRYDGIDSGLSTVFDFPTFFTLRDVLLAECPHGTYRGRAAARCLVRASGNVGTFFCESRCAAFASAEGSTPAKLKLAFGLTTHVARHS